MTPSDVGICGASKSKHASGAHASLQINSSSSGICAAQNEIGKGKTSTSASEKGAERESEREREERERERRERERERNPEKKEHSLHKIDAWLANTYRFSSCRKTVKRGSNQAVCKE